MQYITFPIGYSDEDQVLDSNGKTLTQGDGNLAVWVRALLSANEVQELKELIDSL